MRLGTRRVVVSAAVVGLVVLSSGLTAYAQTPPRFEKATFEPQDDTAEVLTDGVHMTEEDTAPSRAYAAPTSMAVNPEDPRVIAAATANLRTKQCQLLISTDAGASWRSAEERPAAESYPYCTDSRAGVAQSSLAWGSNDTLYYASMAYGEGEGTREGVTSIALYRTTDLGDSWESTLVRDARSADEPKPEARGGQALAVDTSGAEDKVYVGYYESYPDAEDGDPLASKSPVLISVSTDGGESFGDPINLNDHSELTGEYQGESFPMHFMTAFGRPFVTAHDGTIMVVGNGGPASGHPVYELTDSFFIYAVPLPMLVARSTDQGESWEVSKMSPPVYKASGAQTGMGWTPEGGPDGSFVFAYAATPEDAPSAGQADVVVQRSTDMGETWTDPVALNDDDPSGQYTSFYPQLDVAPNGRVDVVWQDNRELTGYKFDVRYTYSTDGGETWAPNVQANDRPIDFNFGISNNSDIRQPPGVASTDEYAMIGWADTRFADELTQTQDIFGVRAQFAPLPAENTTLPVVAAIFGGLTLAGAVLLLLQMRRRRRPAEPERTPVTSGTPSG